MNNKKKIMDEEEVYKLTPMGIALYCMIECGLIKNSDDPRFDRFWNSFIEGMERNEYVQAYMQAEDDYDFK